MHQIEKILFFSMSRWGDPLILMEIMSFQVFAVS